MLEVADRKAAVLVAVRQEVQRGEIARRVVEEHVFRARVRGVDPPAFRAGVPVVDRRVELDAGIGRGPGRMGDAVPQFAGRHGLRHLAVGAADQLPVGAGQDAVEEVIGDPHRVVRVLPGDGQIGLGIPIRVVGAEVDRGVALAGELDHPLDIIFRDHRPAGGADLAFQRRVLRRVGALAAGRHDQVQVPRGEL